MSDAPIETHAPTVGETTAAAGELAKGFTVRNLARKARGARLGGNALLAAGVGLTALTAAVLLWTGISEGIPRVVLLVIATGLLRLRLMAVRLGSVTPADGMDAPAPRSGLIRWLSPIETAVLLIAAGLSPFGSGLDIGPLFGIVAAGLLVFACLRGRSGHAVREPSRPHPTTVLGLVCLASIVEPLWGWRGPTMLIGLCVISAVLIVQVVRGPHQGAG